MIDTTISWCDHTLNLWVGCQKVSPGCKHCYAEAMDHRWGGDHWGPNKPRLERKHWKKELNRIRNLAVGAGRQMTVFVNSMSDIFEDDRPIEGKPGRTTAHVREEFFDLIPKYPELVFLLLTKRPTNIAEMTCLFPRWENVWFGTTCCNQTEYKEKAVALLENVMFLDKCFLSIEPMLGPVNLAEPVPVNDPHNPPYADLRNGNMYEIHGLLERPPMVTPPLYPLHFAVQRHHYKINWVIVGGESGPKARPMDADWVRQVRDDCAASGVKFHFKQWGTWKDGKRYRGKAAGRELDGRTHDDLPYLKPLYELKP